MICGAAMHVVMVPAGMHMPLAGVSGGARLLGTRVLGTVFGPPRPQSYSTCM